MYRKKGYRAEAAAAGLKLGFGEYESQLVGEAERKVEEKKARSMALDACPVNPSGYLPPMAVSYLAKAP